MSANQTCDITRIQDEDVLRQMWQDTEDFGRRKEIRSHMYKIREARLKEFYSSGDINKELHRNTVLKDLKQEATHHADSLIDQSFLSLKSKEIRDSESPTRDISSYKVGDKSGLDKSWSVKEKNETSEDGKCHTTSRLAVTSGSDKIDGGLSNYAAKHEQVASVYEDGDDKNFVKQAGASSQSVIKQEATGGDENSKFYSSSTSSKSSSNFVSEQKSSDENIINRSTGSPQITYKTETETAPIDFKQHPNYIEGKTKVFTETKTLPDGSTVTTTRYETVGGKTSEKTTSQGYTSTVNQQSSTEKKSTKSNTVKKQEHFETKYSSDTDKSLQNNKTSSLNTDHEQLKLVNDEIHLANKYHSKNISREHHDSRENIDQSTIKHEHVSQTNKNISTQQKQSNIALSENKIHDVKIKTVIEPIVEVKRVITNQDLHNKKDAINSFIETERHHIDSIQKLPETSKINYHPKEQTPECVQSEKPVEKLYETPKKQFHQKEKSSEYVQPERRQPIQPPKSEMDTKSKPTAGQYDTTYRTDYTNKRVSMDISPTHDAFARSLRSVTPDRERFNNSISPNRSTPTRTTTTPTRNIERYYPNSRSSSPRKSLSPDKFTSTETITKSVRHPSPKRTYSTETVTRSQNIKSTVTERTDVDSGTITRRSKSKNIDRQKSSSPSSILKKQTTTSKVNDIKITKFDKTEPGVTRPTNLTITKTCRPKKVTERSPTSPMKDVCRKITPNEPRRSSLKSPTQSPGKSSPKEFKPFTPQGKKEKPVLRRRDTYEERCREILGISEKTEMCSNDVDKYKRSSKSTSPKRVVYDKPDVKSRTTNDLKEYPAQRRSSPEKQNIDKFFQTPKTKEPVFRTTTKIVSDQSITSGISLDALTKITDVDFTSSEVKDSSSVRRTDNTATTITKVKDFKAVSPVRREGTTTTSMTKSHEDKDSSLTGRAGIPTTILIKPKDYRDVSPIERSASPETRTEYTRIDVEDTSIKEYKYTSLDDLTNTSSSSRETTPNRNTIKKEHIHPKGAYKNQDFPEYVRKPTKPTEPEDEIIAKSVRYLQGERIPIDEPMITKKFIEKLGSDDEEDDFKTKFSSSPSQKPKVDKLTTNIIINVKDNILSAPTPKEKQQKNVKEINVKAYDTKKTKTNQTVIDKQERQNINKIESRYQPKCVTVKKHTIVSPKEMDYFSKHPKPIAKITEISEKINKQKNKKETTDNLKNVTELNVTSDKTLQPRGRKCCDHSIDRKPTTNGITNITIKTSRKVSENQPQIKITPILSKIDKPKPVETTTIKKNTKKMDEFEKIKKPYTNQVLNKSHQKPDKKILNGNKRSSKTCISTKSIIISDAIADQREIIVDLKRSQSSREDSPDNVWPITTEEDSGIPRYPDQILEPEEPEGRRKPTKLSDIPLTESEDVTQFTRITEMVDTKITDIDRVTETDDCLLTVNEKVSKFTHSADSLTKKPQSMLGPAPKVERPKLFVEESLESDECLLSVSDKVNKFKSTADRLSISDLPERPKSPRCRNFEEERNSTTLDQSLTDSENTDAIIDEYFKIEDSILQKEKHVTEKFIENARTEAVIDKFSTCTLDEKDYSSPTKKHIFETPKKDKKDKVLEKIDSFIPTVGGVKDFHTPPKKFPESSFETPKCVRPVPSLPKTDKGPLKNLEETPKSGKRSTPEGKVILSDVGRLRSTESIKKARALFENIDKPKSKQKDITWRPSVFGSRKSPPKDVKFNDQKTNKTTISNEQTNIKEQNKLYKEEIEIIKHPIDDEDIPGYMKQLDRSLRAKSPHKDSVSELEEISKKHSYSIEEKQNKFGVVLKKTNSDKVLTRRKSSIVLVEIDGIEEEMEIEDIYNLEILERLLETVIGYEIRKRIRTQIRVVKRIDEEKLFQESRVIKAKSPERIFSSSVIKHHKKPEEVSTNTKQYKSTTTVTTERRQSHTRQSPIRTFDHSKKSPSPNRQSPEKDRTPQKPQTKTFSKSPERKVETKLFKTELKPTKPARKEVDDKKPEWVTKTTLRKVSERKTPTTIKTTSSRSVVNKTEMQRFSPSREEKVTDLITSSYGVGPTDENGTPLFGLRALRAQNNRKEHVKVKGVVMQSSFVSKNGEEPRGEISVTEYSSDPRDLGPSEDLEHKHGILSKTTTKKFGKHDTTSKSITDKKYASNNEERKTTSTSTKKISRRGSVKEMSQKFLDNAVETIKNERNSSYPKAGLILRSSSFKDTSGGTSREGSPEDDNEIRRNVKVTSKSSSETNTFLTNTSKITNVQDVITRMKNEDVRDGESYEDTEARSMLNKFLGAQVILSGMEAHVTSPKKNGSNKLETTASTSSSQKRTTKMTTTITENGIPKTITRVFTHPITVDDLSNIWDEESLRFLLEQSSDYEERRILRARIKEIMAANEACSDYVDKTIEECQAGDVQETVETSKETFSEGPFTKTEVTTTKVSSQQISKKPMSPFAKFRQLDKQNSLNTPPSTPNTPTSGGPMFKFTDPNLSRSASTIKERLLQWSQMKTKEYENIKLDNFSTSWADGLAFCALIHHFLPDAFDYHELTPNNRRHNFTLAFKVADEKADIFPLLDVDDMVATRRPDWKCVFTYVQAIYRRFKDED